MQKLLIQYNILSSTDVFGKFGKVMMHHDVKKEKNIWVGKEKNWFIVVLSIKFSNG